MCNPYQEFSCETTQKLVEVPGRRLSKKKGRVMKYLALVAISFVAGVALAVAILTSNTAEAVNRECDDIIRYPNGQLVCEVTMQAEDDDITIIERKN